MRKECDNVFSATEQSIEIKPLSYHGICTLPYDDEFFNILVINGRISKTDMT